MLLQHNLIIWCRNEMLHGTIVTFCGNFPRRLYTKILDTMAYNQLIFKTFITLVHHDIQHLEHYLQEKIV